MKSEKGFMHLLIAAEVIVLIVVILFGVVKKVMAPEEQTGHVVSTQDNQIVELPENTEEPVDVLPTETEEEIAEVTFSEDVEAVLAEMTLEEKVAQLFVVSPETLTGADRVTIAGNGTRDALESYPIGGILYARENYLGQVQMRDLVRGAQTMSNEQSGRYLFAGTLVEIGEETVIACASVGEEEALGRLIVSNDLSANQDIEDMEHIFYVQELESFAGEKDAERLYCYSVMNGGPSAVEALNAGADMLCVTDGFSTVYEAVLEAANDGEISEQTLREAVGRILTKKLALSQ